MHGGSRFQGGHHRSRRKIPFRNGPYEWSNFCLSNQPIEWRAHSRCRLAFSCSFRWSTLNCGDRRCWQVLYATLISGGIAAFTVDSVTGALINVPGSPFTTSNEPNSIAVSPTGKYLYVANFTDGSVDGFAIDTSSGALSIVGGSPFSTAPSPSNLAVDPSGDFLYVSISPSSTIYGFRVDPSSGTLSALDGSPFPSVQSPSNLMTLKIP